MTGIGIIGAGNVGLHLAKTFSFTGKFSIELFTRNPEKINGIPEVNSIELCEQIGDFKAEMLFVCVPDHAVLKVINEIASSKTIIVTGGSIDLEKLNRPLAGVFYPMQTFSAQVELTYTNYPVFIEGTTTEITSKLEELANAIGKTFQRSTYAERVHYHLSAVWVNNFTNHLLYQAKQLTVANNLNWDLFYPLLEETIAKMKSLGPYASQTGPAKRNDEETIDRHIGMLSETQQEMYKILTQSIKDTYNSNENGKL
jgi:predicted short-subunit dehydrogenase-like oxidoreductase (DUF2520 family)